MIDKNDPKAARKADRDKRVVRTMEMQRPEAGRDKTRTELAARQAGLRKT